MTRNQSVRGHDSPFFVALKAGYKADSKWKCAPGWEGARGVMILFVAIQERYTIDIIFIIYIYTYHDIILLTIFN